MDTESDELFNRISKTGVPNTQFSQPESKENSIVRRIPFTDRLGGHGIDQRSFDYYRREFVGVQTVYWKKVEEGDWFQPKNRNGLPYPPSKYEILTHLEGHIWIACEMPQYTSHFAIDLDIGGGKKDLRSRYDAIIKILPNPIVFQSSNSWGLHLYYLLERPMHREVLRHLLQVEIQAANVKEAPGQVEFFPGYLRKLRLPLGKDNYLLDNRSLESLRLNPRDSLLYLQSYPRLKDICFSTTNMKVIASAAIGRRPKDATTASNKFTYPLSTSVNAVIAEPIAQYGTRNAKQMELIRECAALGLSEQETFDSLLLWYRSLKHNSKDWEQNPVQVQRELRLAISNWYQKIQKSKAFVLADLSDGEVQFILSVTSDLKVDGKFDHNAFSHQQFLFQLFQFFKGKNKSELDLPSRAIEQFKGCSRGTAAERIRFCEEKGILKKRRKHSYSAHLNRRFEITHLIDREGRINSFVDGLFIILPEKQIRGLYSRGIYDKIRTMRKR